MSSLVAAHTRFFVIEQLRVPIGILASALFPAISMLAFVVPFAGDDPQAATQATGSLMFFGSMSSALISLSIVVSQDREQPWNTYVRTLPAGPFPRFAGRILSGFAVMVLSVIPSLLVGALFTEATATPAQLLIGLVVLIVTGIPFMLIGLFVGFTLSARATLAVSQLLFFPLAILGGLLIPPQILPGFIEVVSPFTPARGAAELLWWVTTDHAPDLVAVIALAVWTVVAAVAASWAYRRDEGRRFK
ncbi:ABC transporter permease [Nonomuraea jiangxiensis]|uniref:ABC-2 type transport system permease protein n=1 Tax=Nonomuraea jiangxiensis TaxID=633440 RepID=A0A1G8WL20_9ACTN|nr:ABC transporter permease [Nonomuraea jiangxiensis]SDJ79078.1 ABC-2 type transport system permease protein [Nonomuraea jiangxiensis]